MTEFKKNHWYTDGKQYYQYIKTGKDADGNTICYIRQAGDVVWFAYDIDNLIPATLIPDFSDAKVGDECFSPMLSNCLISDINGEWEMYDDGERFEVSEVSAKQKHSDNYTYYYPPTRNTHPLLFNSFAQFQAYWAEQALEMGGEK